MAGLLECLKKGVKIAVVRMDKGRETSIMHKSQMIKIEIDILVIEILSKRMKYVVMIEFIRLNSMINDELNIKFYDGGRMLKRIMMKKTVNKAEKDLIFSVFIAILNVYIHSV